MRKIFIVLLVAVLFGLIIFGYILLRGYNGEGNNKTFVEDLRTGLCGMVGGSMKSAGCGISRCVEKCYFSYRDADKECQSSNNCNGKCIVYSPTINYYGLTKEELPNTLQRCIKGQSNMFDCSSQSFKAKCQSAELANCEMAWEFDHGIIKLIMGDCKL